MQPIIPSSSGTDYFFYGWKLITLPGIRRFVILPLISNILLMSAGFWWLYHQIYRWVELALPYLPEWLHWLSFVAGIIIGFSIAIIFAYLFSSLANIIAAPFNSLLAEKLESILKQQPSQPLSLMDLISDLPRTFKREIQKTISFILWAIPLLLLYLIPVIGQTLAPLLWLAFTSWMLSMQYLDYPFDNHKIPLKTMRRKLSPHRSDVLQFGLLVNLFTLIPLVNLVVMPVAVCGATAMWVDHYYQNNAHYSSNIPATDSNNPN